MLRINLLILWGKTGHGIRVNIYQHEHNEQNCIPILRKRYLAPASQSNNESSGGYWNSNFQRQDLCEPVGNKGGN